MTDQPEPILFEDHVFDFALHPSRDIVCVGLINGSVQCYNYTWTSNRLLWSTKVSKKSCRGVDFTPDGAHVMCVLRDKSIQAIDVATGRLLYKIPKAHRSAINKLCKLDTHMIATGDDDGVVRTWDMRTCKSIQEYKVHQDYIADMSYSPSQSSLVAAGGDGLLSIYDIRKPVNKIALSVVEDELLSMALVEDDNKVLVGSQSGALYSWEWGQWDISKKWLGHPNSVDAVCKLNEDTICTGGNDGLVRLVSVQPYKFEGVLGDHGEDFPVECIKRNDNYLASCGHDLSLRFWDLRCPSNEEEGKQKDSSKRKEVSDKDSSGTNSKKIRADFFENL